MTNRKAIIPEGFKATYDQWRYAPAMQVGDTIHISGQIGTGPDGTVPADNEAQFTYAFEYIKTILAEAGGAMSDIVELTSYHIDWLDTREDFVKVKNRYINTEPYPAWTAIGVAQLGITGALVEIRATAVLGN